MTGKFISTDITKNIQDVQSIADGVSDRATSYLGWKMLIQNPFQKSTLLQQVRMASNWSTQTEIKEIKDKVGR